MIDFDYRNKIGSIELDKNYYGEQLTPTEYKIWKTPAFKMGISDFKYSTPFLLNFKNDELEIKIKTNTLSIALMFSALLIVLIILTIGQIITISLSILIPVVIVMYLFINYLDQLTAKSIKEDFESLAKRQHSAQQ